jgi:hypothetical protein
MSWQASPNVNLRDQREVVSLDLTYTTRWALEESRIANLYQHSLQASFLASIRANWVIKMCNNRQTVGWIWIQVVVIVSRPSSSPTSIYNSKINAATISYLPGLRFLTPGGDPRRGHAINGLPCWSAWSPLPGIAEDLPERMTSLAKMTSSTRKKMRM